MIDVKLVSLLLYRCYSRVGMVGGDQELGLQVPPDPESAHCVWVSVRLMVTYAEGCENTSRGPSQWV